LKRVNVVVCHLVGGRVGAIFRDWISSMGFL
jgi:hypothetical protein